MSKRINRVLSLVLCLALCFGVCTVALAAGNVDVSLKLDTATAKEGELPETITMTVATTEPLTIMMFGAEVTVPDGFSIKEFQNVDKEVTGDITTHRFAWMTTNSTSVQNWVKVVYEVQSDLKAGIYTLGIFDIEASDSDDVNPIAGITQRTVTFTVAEKEPDPIPVSSITLNKDTLNMLVGDSETLTATVTPDDATDKSVSWRSSNEAVATVVNGEVTAVGAGTATITATAGGKTATCAVTVSIKPVPVEGIALADAEVAVGHTVQLEPVFTPANTTQRGVTWASSDESIATVDENGRVKGLAEGKVTITVTSTADATITASCEVTVTPAKNDGTGVPGIDAIIGALGNGSLPFNDVTARDYFFDAVKWAVDKGITSGTSRNTFSPNAPCTRAQVVTFLWRAAGSPQPSSTSNPFTDVHANDYFYDAVLWAVENGITNGTSATTFSPDATVTRAQVVTFLWRANGQPAAGNSGFADVSADEYYATAVAWAVFQRVTTGTGVGVFSPDAACTRAQIVTFLYRSTK